LIIDTGSGFTNAGLSIEDYECITEPTVIGRGLGDDKGNLSYGLDALRRKEYLELSHPLQDQRVQSLEDLEKFYDYLYSKKLKMKPNAFSLLNSYSFDETFVMKKKTIELFFEKFQVPSYFGINSVLLSLYGYGAKNALVVETGYQSSRAAVVKDGALLPYTLKSIPIGGELITNRVMKMLKEEMPKQTVNEMIPAKSAKELKSITWNNARRIKEKLCFLANDYQEAVTEFSKTDKHKKAFDLPDGSTVQINSESFEAPEVLFQPALEGHYCPGLHELVASSLSEVRYDKRSVYTQAVCVSGGCADMGNFKTRFEEELKRVLPTSQNVEILESENKRQLVSWVGGTLVAALTTFQNQWVDRDYYLEVGDSMVFRKCF
jgi:actin beta/gamma 1